MESHFTTRAAKQPSQTHDQHLTCLTYFNPSLLHSIIVAWEDTLRESYDALQVSFIITFDMRSQHQTLKDSLTKPWRDDGKK